MRAREALLVLVITLPPNNPNLSTAPPAGGQLLGKGVDVENYPGLLSQTGAGVVQLMRTQSRAFGMRRRLRLNPRGPTGPPHPPIAPPSLIVS